MCVLVNFELLIEAWGGEGWKGELAVGGRGEGGSRVFSNQAYDLIFMLLRDRVHCT